MIDAPGPWGTGPFTLVEGYSSLRNEIALVNASPFVCMWLTTALPRTDKVVLEANSDHWNRERGPRVEKIVFHNDIDTETAVGMVCDGEGEVDIVTDLTAEQAQRVIDSEHAELAVVDALRIVVGCINRDVPELADVNARKALNMAIDRAAIVQDVFGGYAEPLTGMTPPYCKGKAQDAVPYPHDPEQATALWSQNGFTDRPLRLGATPDLAGFDEVVRQQIADSLGIEVELTTVSEQDLLAAQHVLVEKTIPLPFDVLLMAWFDLTSDAPAAVLHREFYHTIGGFRTGPPVPEFEEAFGRYAVQISQEALDEISTEIDQLVYDQALSIFVVAPKALYGVNRHVSFHGHAATFELAETEVSEEHWSRR